MPYLFTSESVSEGHPDKVADQISDAILDRFLAFDPNSKVACEVMVTTGQVILAGEVKSSIYLDVQQIARDVINKIGYTKGAYMFDGNSCGVLSSIHEQSEDINRGVDRKCEEQGAGDQGMMFGYATRETESYMPLALDLSHRLMFELAKIRKQGREMKYLRPDAKAQVTVEYSENHVPLHIESIVISTQHDHFDSDEAMLELIKKDVKSLLIPRIKRELPAEISQLIDERTKYLINPTGRFVIGGPHGDTGLTGRKIIVDTYGGKGGHGGGAFSGKDPSKVDRSAAYAARHIAKNMVASGLCEEVLVQVSYAIGVSKPIGVYVNTYGTCSLDIGDAQVAKKITKIFDLRPSAIEERLKLRNPIYEETAAYGHMGRRPIKLTKTFTQPNGERLTKEVELFTWEKLDYIEQIKKTFKIN